MPDNREEWEYWSKKRSFTLMEGMMLEFSVLPHREPNTPSDKQKLVEAFIICSEQLELMYSSLRVDKEHGKEWEVVTNDEAASKIISRELFDKHWNICKLPRGNKFSKKKVEDNNLSLKERNSLLKLVIAMAMKKYGYNPSKRTSATSLIKNALSEIGLSLDEETILKFLREGAELLPSETID